MAGAVPAQKEGLVYLLPLEQVQATAEEVDSQEFTLGEKIIYLRAYRKAMTDFHACHPSALAYLKDIINRLQVLCNGGVIDDVTVPARGRFDTSSYKALDVLRELNLLPAYCIIGK